MQGPYHELRLRRQGVYLYSVEVAPVRNDNRVNRVRQIPRLFKPESARTAHEPHGLAVEIKILPSLHRAYLRRVELYRAVHARQRERIRLPRYPNYERFENRARNRQL